MGPSDCSPCALGRITLPDPCNAPVLTQPNIVLIEWKGWATFRVGRHAVKWDVGTWGVLTPDVMVLKMIERKEY